MKYKKNSFQFDPWHGVLAVPAPIVKKKNWATRKFFLTMMKGSSKKPRTNEVETVAGSMNNNQTWQSFFYFYWRRSLPMV